MNCADADFIHGVKSHIEAELDKLQKMEQALAIVCDGDMPDLIRQEHVDYCEFLKNFYLEVWGCFTTADWTSLAKCS